MGLLLNQSDLHQITRAGRRVFVHDAFFLTSPEKASRGRSSNRAGLIVFFQLDFWQKVTRLHAVGVHVDGRPGATDT